MAIVKTTPRETGTGEGSGKAPSDSLKPLDRTKSVVNQGSRPVTRAARQPGMVVRQQSQTSAPGGAKQFANETIAELKRVVWPTKEERAAGTIVTVILLVFFAGYILGLETLVKEAFTLLGILPSVKS